MNFVFFLSFLISLVTIKVLYDFKDTLEKYPMPGDFWQKRFVNFFIIISLLWLSLTLILWICFGYFSSAK